MSNQLRKLVLRAGGLAVVLAASAALAYVLPTVSILRRVVEKRDDLRLNAVEVKGTLHLPPPYAREAGEALSVPGDREIQASGSFQLKLPGRCRLEATVPEGGRSVSVVAQGKRRAEGTELVAANQALSQVCPLLAFRSNAEGDARADLERHLRKLGVDSKITGLGRFDGKIVYVIGAQKPDAAQLWVYKDSFQPARVLYSDAGTRWDVRFRNFGSPVTGDAFPRILEVARGEDLLMRFTALEADTRARLADAQF